MGESGEFAILPDIMQENLEMPLARIGFSPVADAPSLIDHCRTGTQRQGGIPSLQVAKPYRPILSGGFGMDHQGGADFACFAVHVRRLPQAYPIYQMGYEKPLAVLDEWAAAQPNLLVYGRQGLFAHDNTHHALFMAYSAVECLTPGGFDRERWAGYREVFKAHVVED